MRKVPLRRSVPALVVLLVALLAGLSVGSGWIVLRHFRSDATSISRLYSGVFAGLNDPRGEGAAYDALLRLGEQVRRVGIPLIVTDTSGRVIAAANLPFDATLEDPAIRTYAAELDRDNPPITEPGLGTLHYGPVPAKRQLTALAVLQVLILLTIVAVGFSAYQNAMASQRDALWVAMAREAAHQMGTPLMSLEGWIEQLRSRAAPPPRLAEHLEADAERLERVAQRFERIGHAIRREPIGIGALAGKVATYFQPRLPTRVNRIALRVEAADEGPVVLGDAILLEWALESLVKNAIDALQGREGTITLRVGQEGEVATIRVQDDGPGVPGDLRRHLFDAGTSTKSGGWGIGLALARRVVEDSHGGELLLEPTEPGATFLIR
ncbi:MAG TPA: HAMP domain-containing sensor histidine kinase, partial [Gemmatimonadales bacterium]|nr:HAMP domain-containing sensor histidine kinase [Gemmatimonadales bacterium]